MYLARSLKLISSVYQSRLDKPFFLSFFQASMTDSPEINFSYADSDTYENEIAELYSYSEGPEFQLNLKVSAFLFCPIYICP